MEKIINNFLRKFNLGIVRTFPRHSIRFAKKYFKNKPITAIEIGTDRGYNAKDILKRLNVRRIYLIDPYEEYGDYLNSEENKTKKHLSNAEKVAKKGLSKYKNKVIWIKNFSDNAIKKIKEKVDFVYVDGNHEYEYVKRDIKNYWPLIKKGGILAGHDITHDKFNRNIFRAIKEFSDKAKIIPYISRTDWWIVKK